MAPRVHSTWLEHGWWLAAPASEKPTLWITEFAVEEGRYLSALGNSYGFVESFTGTADEGLTVSVNTTDFVLEKYKLQKKLLMAAVPPTLLLAISPIRGLKSLADFWKSIPDEVKMQREALVAKFKELTPQQAFEALFDIWKFERMKKCRTMILALSLKDPL